MTKEMEKFVPFVASLTYDIDEEAEQPMTIEDAQYTMDQWKEEGFIEIPEGFTAEIFSTIWSEWYPAKAERPKENHADKQYLVKITIDGEVSNSIETGRRIAEIYEEDQYAGMYQSIDVWDIDGDPKPISLLDLVRPILENKRWMEQEYRDYCDAVNEYGYDFEGRDE